ncbi:MAG: amino acid adenylation domain-containing protein, partial [Verrucomicrobia bacterium]|nr:amino acid adenylation domain-containing protein [Verrucomicrobiota bacterium]
ERLRALTLERNATLFMTLLAGVASLLQRYCGQDEIVIGAPVAGRNRTQTENIIGFFVNTIVLRCDLRGNPTFRELVAKTRDLTTRAYRYQDLPFEKVVEELHPDRDLSRNPLFQIVLNVADLSGARAERGTKEPARMNTATSPFDLVIHLRAGTELTGDVEYSSELFDPASIEQLAQRFALFLDRLGDKPDERLSEISIHTDSEQSQRVIGGLFELPGSLSPSVVELITAQAERMPSRPAVGSLSYRDLDQAANGVACDLTSRGAGPDTLVAVSLPPGVDLIVALLGIWKAGAAYLPLDPHDPPGRRQQILAQAKPVHLLEHPSQLAMPQKQGPSIVINPSQLAYAIFTSGSTGTPKAVLVEHASVANLIDWHVRAYAVTEADRATLVANPAFDAAVWEIWPYLTQGASLHVPPPDVTSDILDWLARERITITFLPTPLAEAILTQPMPPGLALRYLLTGGDRLRRRPPPGLPFRLINHYGPTETTVVATAGLITPKDDASAPSIGYPIDHVFVIIADQYGHPQPIGVPGELWIGGAGVARGYLGLPDLTATRFTRHQGQRIYRTGDRARYRPDGKLEFLGRLDRQIKVRGFRIEPGEIESQLHAHPGIQAARVVLRENRLVAYVVPACLEQKNDSLRSFLKARLPAYMVPASFQFLPALPLSANGKIAEHALPDPEGEVQVYVAPRTATERLIAGIWTELLGGDPVGVEDDFFALGGHSLLAMQVVSRIRAALGLECSIRTLFDCPTIVTLANALEKAPPSSAPPPIQPAAREMYRARVGADGKTMLNGSHRKLLELENTDPWGYETGR